MNSEYFVAIIRYDSGITLSNLKKRYRMQNKRKIGVIALIGVVSLMIATPFFRNFFVKPWYIKIV